MTTTTSTASQYKNFQGSKYDSSMSNAQITSRIRADIKAAVKSGELPKAEYSVRKSSGRGIRIEISNISMNVANAARVNAEADRPLEFTPLPILSVEAKELVRQLEQLSYCYNYDRSDMGSDYFDTNFYLTVQFGSEDMRLSVQGHLLAREFGGVR